MAHWLRFSDAGQARATLSHLSAQWQRKRVERDMRERLQQVGEHAPEQELEFFVAVSALEQSRASGDGEA